MKNSGFIVESCKVKAKITDNEDEVGITKISLKIEKNQNSDENKSDDNNKDSTQELENKMITEIQKIKKIDTNISKNKADNENSKLENSDIQNLKKFLIKEYEVNEKCLEIN